MVKRVFAWQTDGSACWWYRIKLPLEELAKHGWDVSWGSPAGLDLHSYDVVIGQRIAGPSPEWLALCADPNVLTVYDMDDDLLNLDPENTVPYNIYAPIRDDTEANVRAADVVTVCTPYVFDIMKKINDNVHLLPICIRAEDIDIPLKTHADALTVGWAGSPFHHQDWLEIPQILADFARVMPHASFHMMGADYTQGLLSHKLRVSGFTTVPNYYNSLDFDIGIAPLLKSPSNRGKSHTKPLEYAMRGTPVVATAWGQYTDWIMHGVNGFLVHNNSEWIDYLLALTDIELRAAMSTHARESAKKYTIDKHINLWMKAYGE